jgi:hypothetical protein
MTAARVQSLGLRDMLLKPVSIPSLAHAIARALAEKPT